MRRFAALITVLFFCLAATAQTISYWFQGFQTQPDAQLAQQYFFVPGQGIYFTYATNHVIINSSGGGGTTNYYTTNYYTTNVYVITTNNFNITTNNYTTNLYTITTNTYTTNIYSVLQTNIYATNLIGLAAGTNILFTTNASGVLSINATSGGGSQTPWTANENANNFSLLNAGPITSSSISLTNTGTGSPFLTMNTIGNTGNLTLKYGNNFSSIADSWASSVAPEWDFNVGGVKDFIVGYDDGVSRGMVYSPIGLNGLYVFASGKVAIGSQTGTATANALLVDQPNWTITTLAGVSNIFNGKTFGPGGFIGNLIGNVTTATNWQGSTNVWQLNGNTLGSTNPFIGSLDNCPVTFKVNNTIVGQLGTNFGVRFGSNTVTALEGVAIGLNALGGDPANFGASAVGFNSKAHGSGSSAFGNSAVATGTSSTAVGAQSSASAQYGTALGDGAVASGSSGGSTAVGYQAQSSGNNSVAVGRNTAIGDFSFACGNACTANGPDSWAVGSYSTANYDGSFVWFDDNYDGVSDSAPNQFIVTASGGTEFYTGGSSGGFYADFYTHYRSGNVAVPALATSKTITFSSAMASTSYAPTVTAGFSLGTISMYVDTLTVNGFTVHFTSSVVGGGTLYYTATLNQ
jgi:hypothetical protein